MEQNSRFDRLTVRLAPFFEMVLSASFEGRRALRQMGRWRLTRTRGEVRRRDLLGELSSGVRDLGVRLQAHLFSVLSFLLALGLVGGALWVWGRSDTIDIALQRFDFLGEALGGVAVVFAALRYISSTQDRQAEGRLRAWQVVAAAQGRSGDMGRTDAVRKLARGGESLAGINLDGAWLQGLKLPFGASMQNAKLRSVDGVPVNLARSALRQVKLEGAEMRAVIMDEADLRWARLEGVDLRESSLQAADLSHSKLSGARMQCANLTEANLYLADLTGADLQQALLTASSLSFACLVNANLEGAFLGYAFMQNSFLQRANLTDAHLIFADLTFASWDESTIVSGANVFGAKPDEFRHWARARGAVEIGPPPGEQLQLSTESDDTSDSNQTPS